MNTEGADFDIKLTAALYRAAELDYVMPPDDTLTRIIQPSQRFRRKINTLLRRASISPKRNQRKPIYLRALRTAAAILLVLTMMLGVAMTVSPTVRAVVIDFVRSWFSDRTLYQTSDGPIGDGWTIGYIPKGFELVGEIHHDIQLTHIYENETAEVIFIDISTGQGIVDNEHSVFSQVIINGHKADVYEGISQDDNNIIVMYDDTAGVIITLSSVFDINELIKIVENISR